MTQESRSDPADSTPNNEELLERLDGKQVAIITLMLTCPAEELAFRALFAWNRGYVSSDTITHILLARLIMAVSVDGDAT